MTTEEWNPRFVCYARSHGREPRAQIEHDTHAWPGGKMGGYIIWIGEQWHAWREEVNYRSTHLGTKQHAEFDAWLLARAA